MLTLFATGGTIDKIYFDAKSEFHVGDPQAEAILQEAGVNFNYQIESLLRKDSLDMTDEDRALICEKVVADSATNIVITHGTDGMVATANALAQQALGEKTIVLVGAMQPARMRYSDANFNLGFAVAAVQLLKPGIYIAMNGQVFEHDKVTKNVAQSRFESVE